MQILIFALIGLAALALLVYLFSYLGKKEMNSDPKRVEELWVRAHGDAAMVKMYYKAHTDEERAQIVSFIHSTCPQEPGPNEAPSQGRQPLFFGGPAHEEETAEIKGQPAEAPLFADLDEEEAEELPLSRKERKAQRQQEKAEKAAAKAAEKEAAKEAALAEANKVRVSQGESGEQQEYANLETALNAAIAQVDEEAARQMQNAQEAAAAQLTNQPACPTCGAETLPGCQFCIICGQPLSQPEAAEETTAPPDEAPAEAAAEILRACPACGAEIPMNNRFCIRCGQPLDQPQEAPQTVEAEPAAPIQEEAPIFQSFNLFQALNYNAEEKAAEEKPAEKAASEEDTAAEDTAAEEIEEKIEAPEESSAQQQSQAYQQMQNEFRSIEEGLSASAAALSAEIEAMRAHMDTWQFSEREEIDPKQPEEEAEAAPAPSHLETAPQSSAPGASKDYSATLGLSGALSLEEILRNVQELEKRINKGSDIDEE